ncbi:hypothetical protein C8J55DRAFT_502382 [Lentinula edodes]|uniref:Uncharacterized protein n=1 Tax=Lentinula lateritia TaxID=40482 RepID=A0A9W9AXT8_9AGAR|nr:hypothetical protein C8J55DRAFT_502382 [Lentinula edodes]
MSAKQDYLSSHFEQSRADVAEYAGWIEQRYARPALQKVQSSYQRHPFLSVFAAVFILLSLLPVAIYIGLCLFTLTLLLLLGLCVVVLVSITIALALGFILSLTLLTNLLLSIFITFFLVVAYFSYKIVSAGYTDGFDSARLQILGSFHALFSRVQITMNQNPPKNNAPAAGEGIVDISRSTSPNSTVIDNPEANSAVPNIEDYSTEMKLEKEY